METTHDTDVVLMRLCNLVAALFLFLFNQYTFFSKCHSNSFKLWVGVRMEGIYADKFSEEILYSGILQLSVNELQSISSYTGQGAFNEIKFGSMKYPTLPHTFSVGISQPGPIT